MKDSEQPTIALVVSSTDKETPVLFEALTSADEILELELALMSADPNPLKRVHDFRQKQLMEDEEVVRDVGYRRNDTHFVILTNP